MCSPPGFSACRVPTRICTISRVEVATGKRTLLQTVQPRERAGEVATVKLLYAEGSKTYVYYTVRSLGTLHVVEGLE